MFSDDFIHFIPALHQAKTTANVYDCWKTIALKYPDTKVTVGVNDKVDLSIPQWLKYNLSKNKAFYKSYYSTDSLFFINSELLYRMVSEKQAKLNIDYAVFLDTNMAIYIKNFIKREKLVLATTCGSVSSLIR